MNSSTDWACLICCELSPFKVFGKCNHPICIACSARLRDLCEQKYCPVCREDLDKVVGVFQYTNGNFQEMEGLCNISASKPGFKFEDRKVLNAFRELFALRCKVCKRDSKTLESLEDHLKREHSKFICQICKDNLKVFIKDLQVYTKDTLRIHRIRGDDADKSMKGHPLCEFCQDRFLDNEVLHAHLRKNHFWCHLCDGQAFYCGFKDLRLHFQRDHFLCERGECATEQFTNVFRTVIDLQAHTTSRHINELGKAQQKQMRQIHPCFTTTRSSGRTRGSYNRRTEDVRDRPSSSRMYSPYSTPEQITDVGNWDEPNSSLRGPRSTKIKPALGYKAKVKPPETRAREQPVSEPSLSQEKKTANNKTKSSDSAAASPVSYRRGPSSSQKRPSERNDKAKEKDSNDSASGPTSNGKVAPEAFGSNIKPKPLITQREVGEPPPLHDIEPDVGHPPGLDHPLGDDEDFRGKKNGKKKPASNSASYPPLEKGGKVQNTADKAVWGKGGTNLKVQAKPKQSRKQPKGGHAEEYDDMDFQWLEVDPATEQTNKRSQGKEKQRVGKSKRNSTKPNATKVSPRESSNELTETDAASPDDHVTSSASNHQSESVSTQPPTPKNDGLINELSEIAKQLSSASMQQLDNGTQSLSAQDSDLSSKEADFPPLLPSKPEPPNHVSANKYAHLSSSQNLDSESDYPVLAPSKSTLTVTKPKRSVGRGKQWKNRHNHDFNDIHSYPPLGPSTRTQPSATKGLVHAHGRGIQARPQLSSSAPGSRAASPPPDSQDEPAAVRNFNTPPPDIRTILTMQSKPEIRPTYCAATPPPDIHTILGQTDSYDVPDDTPVVHSQLKPPSPHPPPPPGITTTLNPPSPHPPPPPGITTTLNPPSPHPLLPPGITTVLNQQPEPKVSNSQPPPPEIHAILSQPSLTKQPSDNHTTTNSCEMNTASRNAPPGMSFLPHHAKANDELPLPPGISLVKIKGDSGDKVPPGFNQPPGFGGPPPRLLVSNNKTPQSNQTASKIGGYYLVKDANTRNEELMEDLRTELGPMVVEEFKNAVTTFGERKMDASSFIRICRMFIESDRFNVLFEELLVLLPDIERQTDLYKALGCPPTLSPCTECGQILKKRELVHHSNVHRIDSPSLRTKFQHLSRKQT